jgi:hypothetical protein
MQAMALSVNGVCGNGDGNGEGQSVVWDLEVYILITQGPKQFLFQPRKHLSVLWHCSFCVQKRFCLS